MGGLLAYLGFIVIIGFWGISDGSRRNDPPT